jgi:hypothetical protein
MKSSIAMCCGALMLTCIGGYGSTASGAGDSMVAQASSESGYRVGDTLAPAKPSAPSGGYEDILWDALLPQGWSVEKMMETLNLNELQDNDPKAREALKKIREMWDSAPVNATLDNRRVRIPGFVVPLDGEREKTREFLLVPYFGACIHAPAPPANQVIHVVVSKTASTVKLSPAAWISGTIRTVRSDTRMGVSGYEMTVDKVEPYKQDSSPFPF